MEIKTTNHGTVIVPEVIGNGTVLANLWEKEGKCRIYFKVVYQKSSPATCGFYDVVAQKSYISSTPKNIGRELESLIDYK